MPITVSVGPSGADIPGADHFAIQAAVEYVAARGGGTVELRPGTFMLGNSVRLRTGVSLVGAGPDTLLTRGASCTVALTEDTDWYEARATVADPSPFAVGGGVLLAGRCPHSHFERVCIHTVLGIQGNTLILDNQARGADGPAHLGNFWVAQEATASNLYSLVTGNWISDARVADLRIDGNRENCAALNGNYGAAIYFQDCARMSVENLDVGNIESDCLSLQIVHDLTVEGCRFHDSVQGVHPGSGSQRPVIRGNDIRRCSLHGISWCWGVRDGIAEGNTVEDCATAISIGHRDTHNVMRGNVIRRCERGLYYRDDPPEQAAHHNLIEGNVFEDIAEGVAVNIDGPVTGNVLRGNRFVCTRPGLMRAAVRIGPSVGEVSLEGNSLDGLPAEIEDLRP